MEMNDYQAFRQQYELENAASVPRRENFMEVQEYPDWLQYVVLAMFVTSSALSSVHTAPTAHESIEALKVHEWLRGVAAIGSSVFVELGILVSAYLLFKRWQWFVFFTLLTCLAIAIIANLYSVNRALASGELGTQIVGIALGIGAPLVAALSGKMFVTMHRSSEYAKYKADEAYNKASIDFDNKVKKAFDRRPKMSKNVQNEGVGQPSNGQSGQSSGQLSSGYRKTPNASGQVARYFAEHPEDLRLSARALEAKTGFKRQTINNVQKAMKNGQPLVNGYSANGHGEL